MKNIFLLSRNILYKNMSLLSKNIMYENVYFLSRKIMYNNISFHSKNITHMFLCPVRTLSKKNGEWKQREEKQGEGNT